MSHDAINVKTDTIQVAVADHDIETGEKLEPEQKPAARVIEGDVPVSAQTGGDPIGRMKASIIIGATAGEIAERERGLCMNCKFFDRTWWKKHKQKLESTAAGITELNGIRYMILETGIAAVSGEDGDADVEAALNGQLGVCRALTDFVKTPDDPVIVVVDSTCPEAAQVKGVQMPFPVSFEARDIAAARVGDKAFDEIMRTAQNTPAKLFSIPKPAEPDPKRVLCVNCERAIPEGRERFSAPDGQQRCENCGPFPSAATPAQAAPTEPANAPESTPES